MAMALRCALLVCTTLLVASNTVDNTSEDKRGEHEQPQQKHWQKYVPGEFLNGGGQSQKQSYGQQQNWQQYIPAEYKAIAEKEEKADARNSTKEKDASDLIELIASPDASGDKREEQKQQPQQKHWQKYVPGEFQSQNQSYGQQQNWQQYVPAEYRAIAEKEEKADARNSTKEKDTSDLIELIASPTVSGDKREEQKTPPQQQQIDRKEQQNYQDQWQKYVPAGFLEGGEHQQQQQGNQQQIDREEHQNWQQNIPSEYRTIAEKQEKREQEKAIAKKQAQQANKEPATDVDAQELVAAQAGAQAEASNHAEEPAAEVAEKPAEEHTEHAKKEKESSGFGWPFVYLGATATASLPSLTALVFFALAFAAFLAVRSGRSVSMVEEPLLA